MKRLIRRRVPAGGALAVDRHDFSGYITETLKNHENITVINEEINPCRWIHNYRNRTTSTETLAQEIVDITGKDQLYSYDAAAPIIEKESIDMDKVYLKSRYDKGEAAYFNFPMTSG
ncbi:FAD-dependent oxidoreductase [Staphylococcus aureus]